MLERRFGRPGKHWSCSSEKSVRRSTTLAMGSSPCNREFCTFWKDSKYLDLLFLVVVLHVPTNESRLGSAVLAQRTLMQRDHQVNFRNVARCLAHFHFAQSASIEVFNGGCGQSPIYPSREAAIIPKDTLVLSSATSRRIPFVDFLGIGDQIRLRRKVRLLSMRELDMCFDIRRAGMMGEVAKWTLVEAGLF